MLVFSAHKNISVFWVVLVGDDLSFLAEIGLQWYVNRYA